MRFWWFRVWRLAVARIGDPVLAPRKALRTEEGVWRKLWWVFWWGKATPLIGRPPAPQGAGADPSDPASVLHWVEPHNHRPMCGMQGGKHIQWTIEWNYVSCPACRERGLPIRLAYDISTR